MPRRRAARAPPVPPPGELLRAWTEIARTSQRRVRRVLFSPEVLFAIQEVGTRGRAWFAGARASPGALPPRETRELLHALFQGIEVVVRRLDEELEAPPPPPPSRVITVPVRREPASRPPPRRGRAGGTQRASGKGR